MHPDALEPDGGSPGAAATTVALAGCHPGGGARTPTERNSLRAPGRPLARRDADPDAIGRRAQAARESVLPTRGHGPRFSEAEGHGGILRDFAENARLARYRARFSTEPERRRAPGSPRKPSSRHRKLER